MLSEDMPRGLTGENVYFLKIRFVLLCLNIHHFSSDYRKCISYSEHGKKILKYGTMPFLIKVKNSIENFKPTQ